MALYIALLLLLIPVLIFLKKINQVKTQNKQLPPSPPKLPIIGNLHQLGSLPHQSFSQLSQRYGPLIFLKLGRRPMVVISSAEAAREVLKVHDLACCSRPQLTGNGKITYNNKDVVFSPYGEYWREMRKICVLELFSVKRVQSFRLIREEEINSLMKLISESSTSATPVDLSEKMLALTGSIIFRIAFGKRFRGSNMDNSRFEKLFHEVLSLVGGFAADEYLPYIGWIIDRLNGYHQKLNRVSHELDSFLQQVIEDHLQPGRKKQDQEDIIDVMLSLSIEKNRNESSEGLLTNENIKAVLVDILMAGADTGAIALTWAMAELVKNPRIMIKAQNEVRNYIGKKGRVTEEDIDQLEYLKMIIKETLRLHPPAPLLVPREAISHFKVNGFDIYPKTQIQVNAWAIGRDPKYWEKPEEFFPERFLDNSIDYKGKHFEFLPFGGGRRGCPGIYMGVITTELALANLLYCFDWKLPNGLKEEDINMDEAAGFSLTVFKKTPLKLVPVNYLKEVTCNVN